MLDVLLLLAVTRRLLEGTDDKGGRGGDNGDGSLTVLDGELDGDTESLPVAGGLGDILSDLLGGLLRVGRARSQLESSAESTSPTARNTPSPLPRARLDLHQAQFHPQHAAGLPDLPASISSKFLRLVVA